MVETKMLPKRPLGISPSLPLERFTTTRFDRAFSKLKQALWPIRSRITGSAANCPTLLSTEAVYSCCCLSLHFSNSFSQNARYEELRSCCFRNGLSVKICGTCSNVRLLSIAKRIEL